MITDTAKNSNINTLSASSKFVIPTNCLLQEQGSRSQLGIPMGHFPLLPATHYNLSFYLLSYFFCKRNTLQSACLLYVLKGFWMVGPMHVSQTNQISLSFFEQPIQLPLVSSDVSILVDVG